MEEGEHVLRQKLTTDFESDNEGGARPEVTATTSTRPTTVWDVPVEADDRLTTVVIFGDRTLVIDKNGSVGSVLSSSLDLPSTMAQAGSGDELQEICEDRALSQLREDRSLRVELELAQVAEIPRKLPRLRRRIEDAIQGLGGGEEGEAELQKRVEFLAVLDKDAVEAASSTVDLKDRLAKLLRGGSKAARGAGSDLQR
jgi:hypothetical protein